MKNALRIYFVPGVVLSLMDFKKKMWGLVISSLQQGNMRNTVYVGSEKYFLCEDIWVSRNTTLTLNACERLHFYLVHSTLFTF